ncbi:MAG: 4'-phosphopantetheinyl transferase superfamily protein [Halobacteriales archaeon]|nr:4'-phosphopantetheinyl transferase superfamily protein [Halobacteriales archaeon]
MAAAATLLAGMALPQPDLTEIAQLAFAEDQQRRRVARAGVRDVLARYVGGVAPEAFAFGRRCASCGAAGHGKPHVLAPEAARGLEFSVADAGGTVAVAVARQPVGVDVEADPGAAARSEVAAAFFSDAERSRLAGAADPAAAFLEAWTRKEAVLKALGVGVAAGLSEEGAAASAGARAWVAGFAAGDGMRGAVATLGEAPTLRLFQWEPRHA